MSDFETTASLSVEVDSRELRSIRQEIEDELSDVALGISPSMGAAGPAAGGGGGMDGRERRRRRREFRWARQRTSDMEDAVALLEDIEDKVGGGGAAGGFADDILGIGGDFASEIGGALPGLVANAVGSAVGTAVGQAISANEVSVEDVGELPVERRQQPVDDGPLEVEDTTLKVADVPPLSVADVPPLSVDDPSPLQVEDVPLIEVKRPEWKIGVEQPDPIRVDVRGGGGGGGGSGVDSRPRGRTSGEITRDILTKIPGGERLADLDRRATSAVRKATERVPIIGDLSPLRFGNEPSDISEEGLPINQNQRSGDGASRRGVGSGSGDVTTVQVQQQTDITANVDVNVNTDQIVSETTDAFEQEIRNLKREVERDINQLERRIQRATS